MNENNLIEVNATISRLERDPDSMDEMHYRPVFRYQYNGETYEARKNVYEGNSKSVGQTHTILIDPSKPHSFKYKHDMTLIDLGPASGTVAPKPESTQMLGKNYKKITAKCIDVYQTPDSHKNYPAFDAEFGYSVNGQNFSTKNNLHFEYAETSIGIPLVGQNYELYVAEDDPEDVFFPQPDRALVGVSESSAPEGESIISDPGKVKIGILVAIIALIAFGSVGIKFMGAFSAGFNEATLIIGGVFAAIIISGIVFAIQSKPKLERVGSKNSQSADWRVTPCTADRLKIFETGGMSATLMSSFVISYQANGKTFNETIKTKTPLGNKMLGRIQLKIDSRNPKRISIDNIQ